MTRRLPRRSRKKSAQIDSTKIGKLVRLLGSDRPGEVVAAAAALKRALAASGRDLHDLAATVESGLRQEPPTPRAWGPAAPAADNWQSMAWFCHHHRHRLPEHHRQFVEDLLLGQGDAFDCGQVCIWAITELRSLVAIVQAAR
jgi:hypothetical protein